MIVIDWLDGNRLEYIFRELHPVPLLRLRAELSSFKIIKVFVTLHSTEAA